MGDVQFVGQAVSLLVFLCVSVFKASLVLPWLVARNIIISFTDLLRAREAPKRGKEAAMEGAEAVFYEGTVSHLRSRPKVNKFRYPVRTCCINLDSPPAWFSGQAKDHMTAAQARAYAGTDGPVKLLTNPTAAGYVINPISVYYCYSVTGKLDKCIAEVTNTPWNERVTFVFQPKSADRVKKALHVSPLMDMKGTWLLEASDPGATLKLIVRVSHPEHGDFFYADLVARRCKGRHAVHRNEEAGVSTLWRYGLQSHRIAFWIYWQAVVLLWKGIPLYSPPPFSTLHAAAEGATHPCNNISSCPFTWRPAAAWPWDTWALSPQQFAAVTLPAE